MQIASVSLHQKTKEKTADIGKRQAYLVHKKVWFLRITYSQCREGKDEQEKKCAESKISIESIFEPGYTAVLDSAHLNTPRTNVYHTFTRFAFSTFSEHIEH